MDDLDFDKLRLIIGYINNARGEEKEVLRKKLENLLKDEAFRATKNIQDKKLTTYLTTNEDLTEYLTTYIEKEEDIYLKFIRIVGLYRFLQKEPEIVLKRVGGEEKLMTIQEFFKNNNYFKKFIYSISKGDETIKLPDFIVKMIVGERDHSEEEKLLENLNITPPILEQYARIAEQKRNKIDRQGDGGISIHASVGHKQKQRNKARKKISQMRRPWAPQTFIEKRMENFRLPYGNKSSKNNEVVENNNEEGDEDPSAPLGTPFGGKRKTKRKHLSKKRKHLSKKRKHSSKKRKHSSKKRKRRSKKRKH